MADVVFVKLGGSLITDKTVPMTPRPEVIERCAGEVAAAVAAGARVLLGHGSGSFGHVAAARHGTRHGVGDAAGWRGFAEVAAAARELNRIVIAQLLRAGLAAVSLPPSASARARAGTLVSLDSRVAAMLLAHGALPVVFGDVALDEDWGGTIVSTEQVFCHLAEALGPARIVLAGEVAGVYDGDPNTGGGASLYPLIDGRNLDEVRRHLGRARGADVTGGMLDKVLRMHELAVCRPGLEVQLIDGNEPGLLRDAITGGAPGRGTLIRA